MSRKLRLLLSIGAVALIAWSLGACGKKSKKSDTPAALPKETKTVSDAATSVTAGSGTLQVPVGALSVASVVSLEEVAAPTKFSDLYSTTPKASSSYAMTAQTTTGTAIKTSLTPMSLSLGYDTTLSLNLAAVDKTVANLCAIAASVDGTSYYVWRRAALTVDEAAKTAKVNTIYFGTYQLVFCGTSTMTGFSEVSASGSGVATELEGTWVMPCTASGSGYQKQTQVVSGSTVSGTATLYTDSTCTDANRLMGFRAVHTFVIGAALTTPAGAKKIDETVVTGFMTLYYEGLVTASNIEGICGLKNWQAGVEKELTNADCTSMPEYKEYTKNNVSYDIFKIDAGKLYFGKDVEGGTDGSTDAKRPTELNTDQVLTKQ